MGGFAKFAVRDAALLVATGWLWANYPATQTLEVVLGIATGVCFLLLHEWGHLFGAWLKSAHVHPGPLWGPFLFDADSQANNKSQFLSLSLWGFAATGILLAGFAVWMPYDVLAGKVAWWMALGLTSLTVFVEFPIAWWVWRGKHIPPVEIYRRG